MADSANGILPQNIAALPPTTVRQIGSHQLLADPSSVVKELVDNALDARAKSIFVDIAANTVDCIQVKDNGHGIPSEDRALACRRYCTSKIRDFHDLKEVGGKWLGFRGEALASMADLSGTVSITTRVEGEPVAVKLTYQRNGELVSTERDSHPVGTTVKVTNLLESAKVRKALAIKGSTKFLAKIRRLMQAYALARPAVRFRLHVLKTKNNKADFIYAPKANANVEDAALKIIGKECALQCDWAALEMSGFEIHAYMPKPTAIGSKVVSHGAFISVDARPVASTRGTFKKIATTVRDRLRKANSVFANVKDPFFCLNIICPVDSYDPNIEPAKDDVMFGDEALVVALVDKLLVSYYPNNSEPDLVDKIENKDATIAQPIQPYDTEESILRPHTPSFIHQDSSSENDEVCSLSTSNQQPRWRSNMYGIDEEGLPFLQEDVPDVFEEEEGRRDANISNPWTIARMNAPIKSKTAVNNRQLLSPTKSQTDASTAIQYPATASTPHRAWSAEPLTPQTLSQASVLNGRNDEYQLNDKLERNLQSVPQPASQSGPEAGYSPTPLTGRTPALPTIEGRISHGPAHLTSQDYADVSLVGSVTSRRKQRSQQQFRNKLFASSASQSDETWFGQPMRNAPKASRPRKLPRRQERSLFPHDNTFDSQRRLLVMPAAKHLVEKRMTSKNNTDIRNFFDQHRCAPPEFGSSILYKELQPPQVEDQSLAYAEQESPVRSSPRRPQSVNSYQRPIDTAQKMETVFQMHQATSPCFLSSPILRGGPFDFTAAPERTLAPRPQRRRTTDGGPHQSQLSSLLLNLVPHSFETHNLALATDTSVATIVHKARKLDMTANSFGWGYDTTDALDVFATSISERTIMNWVIKIDLLLHAVFERIDGVEIRGALHEGIQRFLDARREEQEKDSAYAIVTTGRDIPVSADQCSVSHDVDGTVGLSARSVPHETLGQVVLADDKSSVSVGAAAESDEYEEDVDFSQFVDLDGGAGRLNSPVRSIKVEEEAGEGVDDEMLMDL